MRAIVIVMLGVQLLMLAAVAFAILKPRPGPDGRRVPAWSSLAIALLIAAGTSFQIADKHAHDPASEVLQYGSGVLMGMALVALLLLLRERLGRGAER
jgi:hypothetical protein